MLCDSLNKTAFSRRRKIYSDGEDVTSAGRSFQMREAATGKARLPIIVNLKCRMSSVLQAVERSGRRPGKSAIRTSGHKYCGADLFSTLYASTATLK